MALERAESRPVSASSASSPGSSASSAALGTIAPPVAAVSCLGHRNGTHRESRLDLLLGCAILNGFEPSFFFEDTEAQDSPLLGVGLSGDPWLEGVGKAGKQFTASKRLLDRVSGLGQLHVPVAYSRNVVSHHRLRVGVLASSSARERRMRIWAATEDDAYSSLRYAQSSFAVMLISSTSSSRSESSPLSSCSFVRMSAWMFSSQSNEMTV
ncbi:unnamed protein product [Tilletia laevis]|uniref:Uncharacterized protein n=1 Tax=Tilletia laevis TaxID=157183 RepID=A0A9N8MBH0_9BASI|nr:unnamed protein product [Tilletia laevis]